MPAAPPCTSVPFGRAPRAPRRRTPATARRHGAATAPALMVARTRCKQRTRVGAAAPVALRRWRRPHARGTRGRRPITVNRARPVRAPVATPAAFRHPRRQHWRIARRRMSSRRPTASSGRRGVVLCQCSGAPGTSSPTQASARARRMATAAASAGPRARSSGAPASMAATPVAIRRTRPPRAHMALRVDSRCHEDNAHSAQAVHPPSAPRRLWPSVAGGGNTRESGADGSHPKGSRARLPGHLWRW